MKMIKDKYQIIDRANNIDYIDELCKVNCENNNDSSLCDFKIDKIPKTIPQDAYSAYLARKLALDGLDDSNFTNQYRWQTYWFKCCISEKCNFIFSYLQQKNVDRENDLEKICNPVESKIQDKLGDEAMKGYLDAGIDFFLKRYNVCGAWGLYNKYPSKWNINFIKLLLPRMFSAILIGFIPIVTSSDIKDFVFLNSCIFLYPTNSNLWVYSSCMAIVSFAYISFECRKTTRDTQVASGKRSVLVFAIGMVYALIFSVMFAKIGLLGEALHLAAIIFYALFAFLIGILIQLLWEEKTTTEPL